MKKVLCEDLVSLLEKDMQTHLYFYQVDCWCYDVNKSIHQIFEPPPQDVPQQSYGSLMDVMEDTLRRKPGLNPNLLEGHVVITGFLEKTWQESQQKLEKVIKIFSAVKCIFKLFCIIYVNPLNILLNITGYIGFNFRQIVKSIKFNIS